MEDITNPRLLSKSPLLIITALTSFVHLTTSVDLGFRDLHIRLPVSILSVTPLFITVWFAHLLGRRSKRTRYLVVPISYFLGGGLRGAFLEFLLRETGVLEEDFRAYRIFAGIAIVSTTCLIVSFTWTRSVEARKRITELQLETSELTLALEALRTRVVSENDVELLKIKDRIRQELLQAIHIDISEVRSSLEKLVNGIIKPLSLEFSREVSQWNPPSKAELDLSFKRFWMSLDPIEHLRTPVIAVVVLVFSTMASLFAFFSPRDAIEVILGVSIALLIASRLSFNLLGPTLRILATPSREILITMVFIGVSIPMVFVQRIALSGTSNPDIYAAATLIITPVFAWVIITGSAAFSLASNLNKQLKDVRDHLVWVIARINLLNWYQKGVVSRLLHGPVQNGIQVGLLRLRSADEVEANGIVQDVLARVDNALKDVLKPQISGPLALRALENLSEDWKGIADISLHLDDSFRLVLSDDIPAGAIVVDLIHELCSNSIRHGGARRIDIAAECSKNVVEVTLRDDGQSISASQVSRGLGSRFLDSCTVDWNRSISDKGNFLSLSVPTTLNLDSSRKQAQASATLES